ncbi:unnamed protein product [Microthlaspi erraticum]|uniref:Uncharacterized protein n=1 Tax=Microthlaspi erraticum TaxID=1685480 RepID=A0A6D2HHH6_9BRAS|nr:unnamed protein product [Microthlaspi erraticum]
MSTDAQCRTQTRRKSEDIALLRDSVVKFSDRSAGISPSRSFGEIDVDGFEIEHVDDEERDGGGVRESFEVVASASDPDLDREVAGAILAPNQCDSTWGDDGEGFWVLWVCRNGGWYAAAEDGGERGVHWNVCDGGVRTCWVRWLSIKTSEKSHRVSHGL